MTGRHEEGQRQAVSSSSGLAEPGQAAAALGQREHLQFTSSLIFITSKFPKVERFSYFTEKRTAACLIPGHFLSLKGGVAIGRGLNQRSWLDHFLGVTVCDSYRTDLEALRGWDCLTFIMSQMSAVNGTLW